VLGVTEENHEYPTHPSRSSDRDGNRIPFEEVLTIKRHVIVRSLFEVKLPRLPSGDVDVVVLCFKSYVTCE
jgi:hypothetical protein